MNRKSNIWNHQITIKDIQIRLKYSPHCHKHTILKICFNLWLIHLFKNLESKFCIKKRENLYFAPHLPTKSLQTHLFNRKHIQPNENSDFNFIDQLIILFFFLDFYRNAITRFQSQSTHHCFLLQFILFLLLFHASIHFIQYINVCITILNLIVIIH